MFRGLYFVIYFIKAFISFYEGFMGQPATTKKTGMAVATVPDTCKTPAPPAAPVPVPYPNMGQMATLSGTSKKVKIDGAVSALKGSKTSMSNGDEAGVAGGISSGKFIGAVECVMGSVKVKIEGKPAVRMADSTKHNEGNTVGMISAPSQAKVLIG